jgi:hypothetical protein
MIRRGERTNISSQDIKNMFGVWAIGIIVVIIGLFVMPKNFWAGVVLIVTGLIIVPFFIKSFLM